MDPILLSNDVHRALTMALIRALPPPALHDAMHALSERLVALPREPASNKLRSEIATRILQSLEVSLPLAPTIYNALTPTGVRTLLVLALDRFAIEASDDDLELVFRAALRLVDAVTEPACVAAPKE